MREFIIYILCLQLFLFFKVFEDLIDQSPKLDKNLRCLKKLIET